MIDLSFQWYSVPRISFPSCSPDEWVVVLLYGRVCTNAPLMLGSPHSPWTLNPNYPAPQRKFCWSSIAIEHLNRVKSKFGKRKHGRFYPRRRESCRLIMSWTSWPVNGCGRHWIDRPDQLLPKKINIWKFHECRDHEWKESRITFRRESPSKPQLQRIIKGTRTTVR